MDAQRLAPVVDRVDDWLERVLPADEVERGWWEAALQYALLTAFLLGVVLVATVVVLGVAVYALFSLLVFFFGGPRR